MSKNNVLLLYVLFIAPISIALFLHGFFPISHNDGKIAERHDIPQYIENVRIQSNALYKPLVRKLIFMVIDALRWDFIAGSAEKIAMPVTSGLLMNSSACLLRTKLQSPTVTMPRIKAMMTGTVPNFVDVMLNFGSNPLAGDSLLLQAKEQGHKMIFYGDDTWTSLFPVTFERQDGTTSFFVTDFTEVDNNVTRHIEDELNNDDWSIMILHYLGLDHIGHIEGPFGPSIRPKLREMDEIIEQISQRVLDWNRKGHSTLFVVCGDHGMKDSGGHGGSTSQETTVPFVAIGANRCSHAEDKKPMQIEQLDIAATLSVALGLPIPSTNLGSIFLDSIYELTDSRRLFLLYYNTKQVLDNYQKLTEERGSQNVYKRYRNAVKLHVAWLNANEKSSEMVEDIVLSYNAVLRQMTSALISSMVRYDILSMTVALSFLCHILCILFTVQNFTLSAYKRAACLFFLNTGLWITINHFAESESAILRPTNALNTPLILPVIGILYVNCHLLASVKRCDLSLRKWLTKKGSKIRVFYIGALLHITSFAGSSFIEEEHQTWYFFGSTLVAYLFYHCTSRFFAYHRYDSRHPSYVKICTKLLLLLIGHRILRKLNSTGDKYAHLPDIAGWLKRCDDKVGMTLLLVVALILLIWIARECEDNEHRWYSLVLNTGVAICIYFRHMTDGTVAKIPLYSPAQSDVYEVRAFWGIVLLFLIKCGYRAWSIIGRGNECFVRTTLFFIIHIWVMISAMLHQPYNVILLPMQILASSAIDTALRENDLVGLGVFVQYWLGNVFYFYQGNSNSLASIDIAAGYVGLRSYVFLVTSAYLIVNTYSAPVLAYLLLIYHRQADRTHRNNVSRMSRAYIMWRLLTMTVYTVIVTIQRHHLFIWSVFSPKLLFEAAYSVTMCCAVLLVLTVVAVERP